MTTTTTTTIGGRAVAEDETPDVDPDGDQAELGGMPEAPARASGAGSSTEPGRRKRGRPKGSRSSSSSPFKGKKRGVCLTCGEPAENGNAYYCAEHRPLKPDRAPRPGARARAGSREIRELEIQLRTNLEMAAQLWSFSDPYCAAALGQNAAQIAQWWAGQAATNESVRRALEGITGAGGWLGGIAVHAPLVLAIYAHHVQPRVIARRAAQAGDGEEPEPSSAEDGAVPAADPWVTGAAAAGA